MKYIYKLTAILPAVFLAGCKNYVDNDVSKYAELREKYVKEEDFHSELYIFPEKIDESRVLKFRSQHREDLFTGSFLFYLVYQYEDDFENEIERLSSIRADFKNGKSKSIIHFETKSLFLTISKDYRYEFAKYDSTAKRITYVSNQLYTWDELNIDSIESIEMPKSQDDGENSYNMYYFYEGDIGYYVTNEFPPKR